MNFIVECPEGIANEIDQAVIDMAADPHRDDFRDIGEWLIRTGLGEKGAKEHLISDAAKLVSKEITHGLVQITVEELDGESEIKAEIMKDLPVFYPRIDFVIKSGAIDLSTLTYWFKVTSRVALKDLAVIVKKKEITGINSGTLQAFVTLAFCGHDQKNQSPFILIKDKMIGSIDLTKVVRFGPAN